jgi:hypothetical protein
MKAVAPARDTLASDDSRTVPGAPVEPAQFTILVLATASPRAARIDDGETSVQAGGTDQGVRARPPKASDGSRTAKGDTVEPVTFTILVLAHGLPALRWPRR